MGIRRFMVVAFAVVATSSAFAQAPALRVRRSAFTDRVDAGQPVGAADAIPPDGTATYWLEIANAGEPTQVTLVWRVGGREVLRQTLDVGHSPRWHTWARHRLGGARALEVDVLDASGHVLQHDSLRVAAR